MKFAAFNRRLGCADVRCHPAMITVGLLMATSSICARAAEAPLNFSRDIQPILADHCFQCHGPDEKSREADLRLDTREGAFRTANGLTIIQPGKSAESELIRRITSQDDSEVMPPTDAMRQLTPGQVELLRRWVDTGAAWGKHWSYETPRAPPLPALPDLARATAAGHPALGHPSLGHPSLGHPSLGYPSLGSPLDVFVVSRLAREGLLPAPAAARETLLRRVTLDLTGLPPTPEELDDYLADTSPDAYERVVDRLLQSPRYGERWAWDWLDAARYADTNGFQGDPERTMWPWRDWVVRACNADLPYDQFTIEQLAGDLLPQATRDQQLASGFNRNNMHNGEGGRIPEETRVENVFDRVETTATLWLGATFTCCRCHDHKYDPFTLRDYYGLFDIYNQMSETGVGRGGQAPPIIEFPAARELERLRLAKRRVDAVAADVEAFEWKKFPRAEGAPLTESDANKLPGNLPAYIARTEPKQRGVDPLLEAVGYFETTGQDPDYVQVLKKLLAAVRERDAAQNGITKVMIMDQIDKPRDTFVLTKGAYDKPTDLRVVAALPASLSTSQRSSTGETSHGLTRLDLARWLVAPENPLTARVTVNRCWQSFFGTGLVKTVEDFGVQGEAPSHPELLDWLAAEFVRSGWDVKALHRLIVTSATYRQSSQVTAALLARDPENRLLARGPRYRLPSWMLRDVALSVSGLLVDELGGPAVKPYQPEGIWEEATFGKKTYQQDHGAALYRRSLYVFWRRIVGPTMFFDNAARQTCTVKQFRTNTPLHALATLNDITYVEAARVLAGQVLSCETTAESRIRRAFRLVTARHPTPAELEILVNRLNLLRHEYTGNLEAATRLVSVGEAQNPGELDPVEQAALTGLCQLILNLDEALSKE